MFDPSFKDEPVYEPGHGFLTNRERGYYGFFIAKLIKQVKSTVNFLPRRFSVRG